MLGCLWWLNCAAWMRFGLVICWLGWFVFDCCLLLMTVTGFGSSDC